MTWTDAAIVALIALSTLTGLYLGDRRKAEDIMNPETKRRWFERGRRAGRVWQELEQSPGFTEAMERGTAQIKAGKSHKWADIKRHPMTPSVEDMATAIHKATSGSLEHEEPCPEWCKGIAAQVIDILEQRDRERSGTHDSPCDVCGVGIGEHQGRSHGRMREGGSLSDIAVEAEVADIVAGAVFHDWDQKPIRADYGNSILNAASEIMRLLSARMDVDRLTRTVAVLAGPSPVVPGYRQLLARSDKELAEGIASVYRANPSQAEVDASDITESHRHRWILVPSRPGQTAMWACRCGESREYDGTGHAADDPA